jgi:hypothetical protein
MPLSRFTQTLPLFFADAISGSDASPLGAGLLALFAGVGAGELPELVELTGALDGGIVDLLDVAVEGAVGVDAVSSLDGDFLRLLFFGVSGSALALAA